MVVSFASTVAITRYYLELTGYPQVGGGELHIAHLLWVGRPCLSPACYRWFLPTGAALTGRRP